MYLARCLCEGIVLEVSAFMPRMAHCHCHMCQKFHGAAFSTFAEVSLENLHWLKGESLLSSYQAKNQTLRQFCRCCGSSISFQSRYNLEDKTIELSLSLFDQPEKILVEEKIAPDCHIFTESKPSWSPISDTLPQYKHYRES